MGNYRIRKIFKEYKIVYNTVYEIIAAYRQATLHTLTVVLHEVKDNETAINRNHTDLFDNFVLY